MTSKQDHPFVIHDLRCWFRGHVFVFRNISLHDALETLDRWEWLTQSAWEFLQDELWKYIGL